MRAAIELKTYSTVLVQGFQEIQNHMVLSTVQYQEGPVIEKFSCILPRVYPLLFHCVSDKVWRLCSSVRRIGTTVLCVVHTVG
jgi:hypothetical protein